MSWRDRYQQASFRGVEFHIEQHDAGFGRRLATHQYPGRDKPFTEDLGRRAREFSLTAYVVGTDYDRQRDALITACEREGAGVLVHPNLGQLTVKCTGLTVREGSAEGRMARLQLSFIESGEAAFPTGVFNAAERVNIQADNLREAAAEQFSDDYDVAGLPAFVADSVEASVVAIKQSLDGFTSPVAEFASGLNALGEQVAALVIDPGLLFTSVTAVIDEARQFGDYRELEKILTGVATNEYKPVTETTTTRVKQNKVNAALYSAARSFAALNMAQAIAAHDYNSSTEAVAARDKWAGIIDDISETAGDKAYIELTTLRARLVQAVPKPGETLPDLRTIKLRGSEPGLVVAHRLYGDANREAEIIDRNGVRNPAFVPGGVPLEVLANA